MFFVEGTIDTKMKPHNDSTFLDVTFGAYKMIYNAAIDRVGCVQTVLWSFSREIGRDASKPLEHPSLFSRLLFFCPVLARVWGLSLGPCLQSKSKSLKKAKTRLKLGFLAYFITNPLSIACDSLIVEYLIIFMRN